MSALWREEDGGEEVRVPASGASTEGADEDCRSAEDRPGQVTGRSRGRSYRPAWTRSRELPANPLTMADGARQRPMTSTDRS